MKQKRLRKTNMSAVYDIHQLLHLLSSMLAHTHSTWMSSDGISEY